MSRNLIAALSALALGSTAFAAAPGPTPGGERHHGNHIERMERRVDHAVQAGKISPAEGEKLKGDAERIRAEVQADRTANGGRLTPEQKEHVKAEMHAVRDEFRAAKGAAPATPAPAPAPGR